VSCPQCAAGSAPTGAHACACFLSYVLFTDFVLQVARVRSIGVRELRQQASKYLREVEEGETIEVTDRGRPVALLVPVPRASRIEQLTVSGRLVPGAGDLLELGEPLRPIAGSPLPSDVLAETRADER
jgi:prevent-host-death family protein